MPDAAQCLAAANPDCCKPEAHDSSSPGRTTTLRLCGFGALLYRLQPFFVSSKPSKSRPEFAQASVSSRCGCDRNGLGQPERRVRVSSPRIAITAARQTMSRPKSPLGRSTSTRKRPTRGELRTLSSRSSNGRRWRLRRRVGCRKLSHAGIGR